jgi:alpha-tubulin suppressor-like RCC1 family protein
MGFTRFASRLPRLMISLISALLCLVFLMPMSASAADAPSTLWNIGLNSQTFINLSGVTSFDAGSSHNLAIKGDGTVWAWGSNTCGEIGNGVAGNVTGRQSDQSVATPFKVLGPGGTGNLTDVTAVAAGSGWSLALKSDGTVWAWGNNNWGALGIGTSGTNGSSEFYRTSPVQVHGENNIGFLSNIIAIAAGETHSLALDTNGNVWAWGTKTFGELGNNSSGGYGSYVTSPVKVHGLGNSGSLSNITAISAGYYFSLALDSGGQVWAWGFGSNRSLGQGTDTSHKTTPVKVKNSAGSGLLNPIDLISAGYGHCMAYNHLNGTVYTWGFNLYGAVGDGTADNTDKDLAGKYVNHDRGLPFEAATLPIVIGGGGNYPPSGTISISAGPENSLVKNPDGSLTAWGAGFGTQGSYPSQYSMSPVLLDTLHDVTAISAGGYNLVLGPARSTSSVAVQSSNNPSYSDNSVTFTATVTGASGYPVAGTVDFYLNNGIGNLRATKNADGTFSYAIPWNWFIVGGNNLIVAKYSGDYNNLPSTSSNFYQTFAKLDSTTTFASSPNPSDYGESVTFTATVSGPAGKPTPTGSVSFSNGLSGSHNLVNGQFTFTNSALPVGTTSITASYSGNYNSSNSNTLNQKVNSPPPDPNAPVVSGIPDVILNQRAYTEFNLDQYVTDRDTDLNSLTWTWSGDQNVAVYIQITSNSSGRIAAGALIDATQTDWTGSETITFTATDPDGHAGSQTINVTVTGKGDINADGSVNLIDAILALKSLSGIQPSGVRADFVTSSTDVNGDGKIGLAEVIYIIQKVAEVR